MEPFSRDRLYTLRITMQQNCSTLYCNTIALVTRTMPPSVDPIHELLMAHGLRRTPTSTLVLGWFLAHPDTSYTHAQLLTVLAEDQHQSLDKVTLYRVVDRLTQVGLLLCRVDVHRVRRFQAMPVSVHTIPHFECQTCHRDSPLNEALQASADDLERAAQNALLALQALGYQGYSVDVAVRGVCAACSTGARH